MDSLKQRNEIRRWKLLWEEMRQYNVDLERYLCQCIVALAQNNIAPPDAPPRVEGMLREKFINAIKGES